MSTCKGLLAPSKRERRPAGNRTALKRFAGPSLLVETLLKLKLVLLPRRRRGRFWREAAHA